MSYYFFFFSFILLLAISPTYGQILNAGFENWTYGTPDDWMTNDASGVNPITASTSRHSGSLALKGTILERAVPLLFSGADGNGFPISIRPEALHGFYILVPSTNFPETLVVAVSVSKQDTVIGLDTLFIGNINDSYQEFVANIHYLASGTPDLVNISVSIGRFGQGSIGTFYLLDDLSFGPAVGVDEPRTTLPSGFELAQNYPNPFNPSTVVSYQLPVVSWVTLEVFDMLGREVATLVNGMQEPGYKSVTWNAANVPSGVYFYRVQAGNPSASSGHGFTDIKKMLLVR